MKKRNNIYIASGFVRVNLCICPSEQNAGGHRAPSIQRE
ncbi:hypothetical protein GGR21_003694 [Dysgonomonas hofstadii]|uniref:Uncharacterized protein n=1 Tax=Dysgonomonas hofstadii TaxID=637886 RepID=A0A840D0F8_9BACT|nr:hypothetical protein [Dysgonomonas hofstadii]